MDSFTEKFSNQGCLLKDFPNFTSNIESKFLCYEKQTVSTFGFFKLFCV